MNYGHTHGNARHTFLPTFYIANTLAHITQAVVRVRAMPQVPTYEDFRTYYVCSSNYYSGMCLAVSL